MTIMLESGKRGTRTFFRRNHIIATFGPSIWRQSRTGCRLQAASHSPGVGRARSSTRHWATNTVIPFGGHSSAVVTCSRRRIATSRRTRVATVSGKGIAGGDANAVASEELAAAQKELERIEPLRNEGIVSERDYQSALSTVKRLSAAYSGNGSGSAVTASQKATIIKVNVADGEWVEAGTPVVETSTDSRLFASC